MKNMWTITSCCEEFEVDVTTADNGGNPVQARIAKAEAEKKEGKVIDKGTSTRLYISIEKEDGL